MTTYDFGGDTSNWITADIDNQNPYQYIDTSYIAIGSTIASITFTLATNGSSSTLQCDIRNNNQDVQNAFGTATLTSASATTVTFTGSWTVAAGDFICLRVTAGDSIKYYVCASCTTANTNAGYFTSNDDNTQYNYDGNSGRPNRNSACTMTTSSTSGGTRLPPPPIQVAF